MFNKQKYIELITYSDIFGFHKDGIKLKSGRISYYYANFRNALENPEVFVRIINHIIDFIRENNIEFDCIYGVPEGATPWGVAVSYELIKNKYILKRIAVGRGKVKEHGDPKNRYFVCAPEGKVLLIEDVTTTGSSLLEQVNKLREIENIEIIGAISLLNRCEIRDDGKTVKEILEENNIPFYSLADINDILPIAVKILQPKEDTIRKVYNYYETYCKPKKLALEDLLIK